MTNEALAELGFGFFDLTILCLAPLYWYEGPLDPVEVRARLVPLIERGLLSGVIDRVPREDEPFTLTRTGRELLPLLCELWEAECALRGFDPARVRRVRAFR